MAAPTIATEAFSEEPTDVTTHDVTLPSGMSVGDLVVVAFGADQNATNTWPSGWTPIVAATPSSTAVTGEVRAREVDGTEGSTIQITTSSAQQSGAWAFRIAAAEWHGTLVDAVDGVAATGTSTTPDPPSLDPADWASEDTLWLAVFVSDNGNRTFSGTYPTNYTNGAFDAPGDAFGIGFGRARRGLNASSEDPGAFSALSASEEWTAFTLAIRPVAAGGTTHTAGPLSVAGSGAITVASSQRTAVVGPVAVAGVGTITISNPLRIAVVGPAALSGTGIITIDEIIATLFAGPLSVSGSGLITIDDAVVLPGGLNIVLAGPLALEGVGTIDLRLKRMLDEIPLVDHNFHRFR